MFEIIAIDQVQAVQPKSNPRIPDWDQRLVTMFGADFSDNACL